MDFLRSLLSILFPLSGTAEIVEKTTPESLGRLLSPRVLEGNTFGLLSYKDKTVRAVIVEAKFHGNARAIELLSGILREYMEGIEEERAELSPAHIILVPVPLGERRKKERGYNQVERVCSNTDYEVTDSVRRVRETAPQTSLSRAERLQNVANAFEVAGEVDSSVHYVVVDDVTTTGATMREVMHSLSEAGAQDLSGIALAY